MSDSVIKLERAFVYQRNYLVLSNIDLELMEGEFAYLIGKTGSGKSSLLKILYGELPLNEGYGKVGDIELNGMKTGKIPVLRRHIGIVFQDFQLLLDRNVERNLSFVLKATGWKDKNLINDRIDEVLESVGMISKKKMMPFRLSGGEQQRISIARALLNHPKLILADEPTGNLDPETSSEIMNLILNLSQEKNVAVLMATHDYNIIQKFPARTLRCVDGKVITAEAESLFSE